MPTANRNEDDPVTGNEAGGAAIGDARSWPTLALRTIPGGTAILGTGRPIIAVDEEGPRRTRRMRPFRMMETAVTNAMFEAFVSETGFVTEAERFGWSFVFHRHVSAEVPETQRVVAAQWWCRVDGASWRLVNGPGSEADWHRDHPAVHVSWNDARAFAKWAGGRLPTEAEWEHAARGGLGDAPFPWGEREPDEEGFVPCNIWQGRFPDVNTGADGYLATAPAKSFEPNGYGLYNMCGNVWEWTSDPMKLRSLSRRARDRAKSMAGAKWLKGGSYLCHRSYCFRYRIAARTGTTPDTSTAHQGFRLVFDGHGNASDRKHRI